MSERPTPVVICSSLTQKGAETSLQALSAGAVEIITKPSTGLKSFLIESAAELVAAIRAAANSNVRNLGKRSARPAPSPPPASKLSADAILPAGNGHAMAQTTERIVAIGTSTGGTQALEAVLTALPRVCPGIVIVQHMPEKFTASFAERLEQHLRAGGARGAQQRPHPAGPGPHRAWRQAPDGHPQWCLIITPRLSTDRWLTGIALRWMCCFARWPGLRAGTPPASS